MVDVIVNRERYLSNSIQNTSISVVISSWTTLYLQGLRLIPTCRVELLAQLCHVVVGPRPLPIGEELERPDALPQPAHAAHEARGLPAGQAGRQVEGVRWEEVQEDVQHAVLHLVPRHGDAGGPEISYPTI